MTGKLRAVPDAPKPAARPDLHDYEHLERQRIAAKDWAKLHVRADRSEPVYLLDRPKRGWRA
jgi:hypothetical protein